MEEGDLVVHLQYGIGKFLGLKNLPVSDAIGRADLPVCRRRRRSRALPKTAPNASSSNTRPPDPGDEPPKLYVPVTEAHLVSKYVGAGKAHPPLNTLGGTRWHKAKEQAERAVRDVAAELLRIQAARETQPGHAFKPDAAVAARI